MQKCTASWLVLDACTFLFKFHRSNIYHGLNLAEGAPPIVHSFLVTWKYLKALWQTNQLKNSNDAIKFDKSWQYHKSCQYQTRRGFPNEVMSLHWTLISNSISWWEKGRRSFKSQQWCQKYPSGMECATNNNFDYHVNERSSESRFVMDQRASFLWRVPIWRRERSQEIVFLKWFPGISDFFLLVAGFSEPSNFTRE